MPKMFFASGTTAIKDQLKKEGDSYMKAIANASSAYDISKIKERMVVLQAQLSRALKGI